MEKSIQEKSVKENQDVICLDDIHGFVSNIRIVYFDEKNCQHMLSQDLNSDIKRELLHACYISQLVQHMKNDSFNLSEKRNAGDSSIRFNRTLNHIKNYTDEMMNKIKGQVSLQEFNDALYIVENALCLSVKEKEALQQLIVYPMKEQLQVHAVKNKMKC